MARTYKQDHELMRLLNLTEISRVICDTNMGTLKLRIRKGETEYRFILDAVELNKNTNKEVMELLYPIVETVKEPSFLHNLRGKTETSTAGELKKIVQKLPNKKKGTKKK